MKKESKNKNIELTFKQVSSLGGKATRDKYGNDHFREIQKKAVKKRLQNKHDKMKDLTKSVSVFI